MVLQNDAEVALNKIEAFNDAVGLIKMCLWEDEHHETSK